MYLNHVITHGFIFIAFIIEGIDFKRYKRRNNR